MAQYSLSTPTSIIAPSDDISETKGKVSRYRYIRYKQWFVEQVQIGIIINVKERRLGQYMVQLGCIMSNRKIAKYWGRYVQSKWIQYSHEQTC